MGRIWRFERGLISHIGRGKSAVQPDQEISQTQPEDPVCLSGLQQEGEVFIPEIPAPGFRQFMPLVTQ